MTELATIHDHQGYQGLIDAFKARAAELNITMETIDDIAGLSTRYCSKVFSPRPSRGLGRVSFGPLLGALAVKLVVMEDEEALARVQSRLIPRQQRAHMASDARHLVVTLKFLKEIGAKGGEARASNLTRRRLSQIGRMGAKARWHPRSG